MKELKAEYKDSILFRIGERIFYQSDDPETDQNLQRNFLEIVKKTIARDKRFKSLQFDLGLKTYALEDLQIVLTNSIPASRIIKVISDGTESGRQRRQKKKVKLNKTETD